MEIKSSALAAAQVATSATSMVRTLLVGAFPMETLLRSNLKGGKSKRPSDDQLESHTKLDDSIMETIYSKYIITFPFALLISLCICPIIAELLVIVRLLSFVGQTLPLVV